MILDVSISAKDARFPKDFTLIDPRLENIRLVCHYMGFEIWKYNSGPKGIICFRYTSFGRPYVEYPMENLRYEIPRMPFYSAPFTSVNVCKDWVKNYVKDK